METVTYDPNLTLGVCFCLTDKAQFWQALAAEAAAYDEGLSNNTASYSQAQAFLVVFHRDGLETISRLMSECDEHLGWYVDGDWGELGEVGAQIITPDQEAIDGLRQIISEGSEQE